MCYSEGPLPQKVRAALGYVSHHRWLVDQSDPTVPAYELSPQERRVYAQALHVLSLYFTGEMDFADTPPPPAPRGRDGDEPEQPATVPA